ncbi:tyrosine-type recombinase/integrase [Roseomonas fluvialis]|uniref:Tyr recombinase domain-containing protein n=1 Tax=Roseomonas fluvialis TaxID=1750527 RepID=A0ABN6NZA0_9PROT|nr:tyrosine-type recombinase/integrase [Roseomonas fluvialis]BDG71758.1 hypothetical protein Rmf_16870 [Roseomonas fluvialis]
MLIAPETHLGYRPAAVKGRNGTWIARRAVTRPGERTKYKEQALGAADDHPDSVADGTAVRTYHQAMAAAREWSLGQMAADRALAVGGADVTVKDAIETYVAARKRRAAIAGQDAEWRLTHHVVGAPLAGVAMLALTETDLTRWRRGLKRGGRGKRDDVPLAPSTLARLLNDLRAALTAAARRAKAPSDLHTIIHDGTRPPESPERAREMQVLPDADVRRLVETAEAHDPDFGALVTVLATTGARFGQAARLTVADLQPEARRVMLPPSRKGRGKKQVHRIAVPLPDDVVARLRALASGRAGHEPLLMRWRHKQVPGPTIRWEKQDRVAWSDSADMMRGWTLAVAAAKLPKGLVPYCLRHSSIVRGLRAGLPIKLVASVHDTSTSMIDAHYGKFIVDATEDLLRRALVPMASANVTHLRLAGADQR